jgi:hypothetical protein
MGSDCFPPQADKLEEEEEAEKEELAALQEDVELPLNLKVRGLPLMTFRACKCSPQRCWLP